MLDDKYLYHAFRVLSYAPGPFWLILLLIPLNKIAMLAFDAFLMLLALHFSMLTIPYLPELLPAIASPDFTTISTFLASKSGFVGSWNHMILSDLWIGRWIARDGASKGVYTVIRVPFVVLTMFFGPLGLACYLIFRIFSLKRFALLN